MNRITVNGNLGADPELKYSQAGMAILKLRVADSYGRDEKRTTIWHNVTAFGDLAENSAGSLTKGNRVMIEGRLTEDNYTNKEGVEVKRYEILADDIALSLRFANTDPVERTQAAPAPAEAPF